ncbi:MAG: LuxR C-terminal-related transcriptional regulator [Pusillimonas sp.]
MTPRQYEVLVLLSKGLSLKAVARSLNISLGTAKAHTEAMYQRLGAHNRNEAVYMAHQKGALLAWEPDPDKAAIRA